VFGRQIKLFSLFGFSVRVDASWLIVAFLAAWTLAQGLFPQYYKGLAPSTYWWMGVAGAAGLFVSIVFHECCHSLVARRYGLPISGITLFVFGGVSEMTEEPRSPRVEFFMAAAGPASSFVLAAIFYLCSLGVRSGVPLPVYGVIAYLGYVNVLLGCFNLLPAFPLDGGRVLRSALWRAKGNLRWATRVATRIGSAFGAGMILVGVVTFVAGNFVGGVWWFLIGMFLRSASIMSYRQLLIKGALEGEHVRELMKSDLVTIGPSVTLDRLMDDYIYRYPYKMFPVVDGGRLFGVVSVNQLREIPREEWAFRTVKDVAATCTEVNTIEPDADAIKALEKMNKTSSGRLMVVERGRLVGILALRDLLSFLSRRLDLGPMEA
jgi:Zn-dependent protease/CBS domain-containing protein